MKRFTGILAAAAIALAPMSASALEALTDNAMNDVTAQAGVSIAIDNVVIYQEAVADTIYRDTDGLTSYAVDAGTGGLVSSTIGVSDAGVMIDYDDNIKKLTLIDAIVDDSTYGVAALTTLFGTTDVGFAATGCSMTSDPTIGGTGDDFTTGAKPLTIDIGTCSTLTAGLHHNLGLVSGGAPLDADNYQIAGVIIGLPTIEITQYHTQDIKNIKIVSTDATAKNADKSFIQIEKTGFSKMAILGGTLEIAPH